MRVPSFSLLIACPMVVLGINLGVNAQIVGDHSLATPTRVQQQGNLFRITQGTQAGQYLFHSFQDFSIERSQTAHFVTPQSTRGIIARVTGQNPSLINGTLRADGNADVLFFNPSGMTFGSRAQLDIGGSFIGSTAEQIQFDNGTQFQTNTRTAAPPLLQISTPSGLQFGPQVNPILVQGPGHGLKTDPETLEIIPVNRPIELLRTQPMTSISLIGGGVTLSGGNLQTSGGRIYLGALGPNQSLTLQKDRLGWKTSQLTGNRFEDILLEQSASLITNGNGGGEIQLQGRFVDIFDGSTLLATSFGTQAGRGVILDASEGSVISGVWVDPQSQELLFPSSIFAEVGLDQDSNGGSITIRTPDLEISDGAQISTSTLGFGNGGDIDLNAQNVLISGGTDTFGPSGLYLDVADELTEGNGGNLDLQVDQLILSDGATISASTFGFGNAGLVRINAQDFSLIGGAPGLGASSILAQVEGEGSAQGIRIKSDRLSLLGGAQISTSTFGSGNGGLLQINSPQIRLDGTSPAGSPGGLLSSVERPGTGRGGAIQVITDGLILRNGAEINSSTRFRGDAGEIRIRANDIEIDDSTTQSTGIFSTVERNATGTGASITVNTQALSIIQGGQISSGTLGNSNAGSVMIQADRIELQGQNAQARSGIFASALNGQGQGGDITVKSRLLSIQGGATVNVSNFPSDSASLFRPGRGAAGSIQIVANNIIVQDQGSINASTAAGDRGNLTLESDLLLLSNQSQIATDTTSSIGGNINITTQRLFGLNNSDITANASEGRGGQVNITANQILGIEARSQLSPLSDITASSALGAQFAGTVQVNILEPEPKIQQNLTNNDIIDASQLIARSCFQRIAGRQGRFVLKGSGGVAAQPYTSTHSFFDILNLESPTQSAEATAPNSPGSIFSANQWMILPNGQMALGRTC